MEEGGHMEVSVVAGHVLTRVEPVSKPRQADLPEAM